MYKILVAAFVLVVFAQCDELTVGGPCEYEDIPFKATIVSIEKDTAQSSPYPYFNKDSVYRVRVVTNVRNSDTMDVSSMIEANITESYVKEHQLEVGTVLEGTAHLITKGTCHPGGYRFNDSTLNAH